MKSISMLFLSLLMSILVLAGDGTKGGLVVQVDGNWVPLEEALSYDSATFEGIGELPTGSPNDLLRPVFNKPYKLYFEKWLEAMNMFAPGQSALIALKANLPRFVYINRPLALKKVDELPNSDIDYKKYLKAAVFRKETNTNGVIYVSIPVMEDMGSIGIGRLTKEQNQGFIILHEMLHVAYPNLTPNGKEQMGQMIIEAALQGLNPVQYGLRMARRGLPYLFDNEVRWEDKMNVLILASEQGILDTLPTLGFGRFWDFANTKELYEIMKGTPEELLKYFSEGTSFSKLQDKFKLYDEGDALANIKFSIVRDFKKKAGGVDLISEKISTWYKPRIEEHKKFAGNPLRSNLKNFAASSLVSECKKYISESQCETAIYKEEKPKLESETKYQFKLIYSPMIGGPDIGIKPWSVVDLQVRWKYINYYNEKYDLHARIREPGSNTWKDVAPSLIFYSKPSNYGFKVGFYILSYNQ